MTAKTPLHLAVSDSKAALKVVQYLIRKSPNVNQTDNYRRTPLHWACKNGASLKIIKDLISKGAKVDHKDNSGKTPLHLAVSDSKASLKIVQYLIRNGAKVDQEDNEQKNAAAPGGNKRCAAENLGSAVHRTSHTSPIERSGQTEYAPYNRRPRAIRKSRPDTRLGNNAGPLPVIRFTRKH